MITTDEKWKMLKRATGRFDKKKYAVLGLKYYGWIVLVIHMMYINEDMYSDLWFALMALSTTTMVVMYSAVSQRTEWSLWIVASYVTITAFVLIGANVPHGSLSSTMRLVTITGPAYFVCKAILRQHSK